MEDDMQRAKQRGIVQEMECGERNVCGVVPDDSGQNGWPLN